MGSSRPFLYGVLLLTQTRQHRNFFTDVHDPQHAQNAPIGVKLPHEEMEHPSRTVRSVAFHAVLLVATLLPVVLLSKPLAKLLDFGIAQAGVPSALGAILILPPEGMAAIQAAARNHLQRSVNLSLGSALSTIELTVPVVLAISVITGTPLDLGLNAVQIVLLALTPFVCNLTLAARRPTFRSAPPIWCCSSPLFCSPFILSAQLRVETVAVHGVGSWISPQLAPGRQLS